MATPEELATQALDQLLEATVLLGADMSKGLAAMGLTESRAHLLYVLQASGPCTQRSLAEALGVAPRTITGLVDALVETGFVSREPHPTDRRARFVTLTDHGAEVAGGLDVGRSELAEALFADLHEGELAALIAGLDATLDTLRALVRGEEP